MSSFSRSLSISLLLGCVACSAPPTEPFGVARSRITSGSADDTDGSVVWIVAKVAGQTGYCSGVVVSPHVVLSAGHCADPKATYTIFLGSDYTDATAKARSENYIAVTEQHPAPKYDPDRNLHDIAVLVTSAPIPRTPAAINRTPLKASDRGAPIRIVGFGQTSADKTIGRRYAAMTTIADYDAMGLAMSGTPSFCLFDSGGPTFMERGGTEVVVGIHSLVESTDCDKTAWDARVDVEAAFVDAAIAKADPPAGSGDDAGDDAAAPPDAPPPAAPPPTGGGCSIGDSPRASGGAFLLLALASCFAARARRARVSRD